MLQVRRRATFPAFPAMGGAMQTPLRPWCSTWLPEILPRLLCERLA